MQEIDFKQIKRLWTLRLVVETGSIKRAAVRANVTSSAVSQAITGLEGDLKRKLLLRKKGQLLPTEHGRQLLLSAESAFSGCFDLQKNLSSGTCALLPKIDWLDFAATESLAIDILPQIMRRLRTQLPDIRLKVKSGRSAALTLLVKKGELCMALVEENDFMEGVTCIPVSEDRLGLFCSVKEPIRNLGLKTIEKLGVGILSAGSEGHSRHYSKFIKILGQNFKPTLTGESYEILRAAAVEGSIVAVLPTRVAHRRPHELIEISPHVLGAPKTAVSNYQIFLVSEPGCSAEENAYLAQEIKSIIQALHRE
jgi:DNA-binding transcriptional LysR family regulator